MGEFQGAGLVLLGYLAGSIPTGYLVVKWLKGYDIRTRGSGNPGTANVYRNAGPLAGGITLLVDALKGFAPVLLALRAAPGREPLVVAVGAAAIVGHNWSPFLGFHGGKGVATSAGVFLALLPLPMALTGLVFLAAARYSGHISVGSMSAAVALPAVAAALRSPPLYVGAAGAAGALILYKHVPNIRRLLKNKELGIHGPSA